MHFMKVFSKIEASDITQFMGLVLLGAGLFLCYGIGFALMIPGIILIVIGFFGNYEQKKQ